MRSLLLAVLLCLPLSAQAPNVSGTFQGGHVSSRLILNVLSPPQAGDRIEVDCSTRRLRIALITPGGERIMADNASTFELDWSESPFNESDWGKSVVITFRH